MPRTSSRLERREQKKLLRQTFFFIGVALIVGLSFIFLIIPNFIRILNHFFQVGPVAQEDTLPPQVPILAAPQPATQSAQLAVSGFGEAESEVIFVLNGAEVARERAGDDGSFSTEISLTEGENSLVAYAVDTAGNESNLGQRFQVVLDTQPPELTLDGLQDGQEIIGKPNQQLKISGTTEPNARVYVNGRLSSANSEGAFSVNYFLAEGENSLNIEAVDAAMNTAATELTVTYRP